MVEAQMDIFTQDMEDAMRPDDRVDMACIWIRDNRDIFRTLMHIAHKQVDKGNPCLRRGDVARMASEMGLSVSLVKALRFDNNLWSVLSRIMVMLQPRLARCLHFRRADVDTCDLQFAYHRIVNPQTCFLADSWMAAEHLVEIDDASAAI